MKILIIGEIFVDQYLDIKINGKSISRLGGIFHAARACDALNIEFALAYYAPNYLEKDIKKFGEEVLGASDVCCLGIVDKAPNVILVAQSDESGNLLYENILCEQAEYIPKTQISKVIDSVKPTDVMIFPGRYGNKELLKHLSEYSGRISIDMNYDCEDILALNDIKVETVFLSTSSTSFQDFFKEISYKKLIDYFKTKEVGQLLIKENRGGSYLYNFTDNNNYEAPAFVGVTEHSVGVGDVYDIAYIFSINDSNISNKMIFASWVSALYAQTLQHEMFKENVNIILLNKEEFLELEGIRVPWNERVNYPIYMAAPDFSDVNTEELDILEKNLLYHNFRPRRPIKENGQVDKDTDIKTEIEIFIKDIQLLTECKLMIATLFYNDQGTLVEIGNYQASGKKIILYDPYRIVNNMFLKNSCTYYCNTKKEVIEAVYYIISEMIKNEK